MKDIDGIENEYQFVDYLNGKKVYQLNPLFRDLIDYLFPDIKENYVIYCWKNRLPEKRDIFIKADGKIRSASIKKGAKNSVHVERISDFVHFLIDNEVPKEIIIEFLKYHYADGSTNGKGKKRISSKDYKEQYQEQINMINHYLNNDILIKKAINRFICKGNNSIYSIDVLIYGQVDDFLWLSKEDIIKIIISKKSLVSSGPHFSVLSIQPKTRNLNYNPRYEKDRFSVQIKWYSLFDDIIEYKNNCVMNS